MFTLLKNFLNIILNKKLDNKPPGLSYAYRKNLFLNSKCCFTGNNTVLILVGSFDKGFICTVLQLYGTHFPHILITDKIKITNVQEQNFFMKMKEPNTVLQGYSLLLKMQNLGDQI